MSFDIYGNKLRRGYCEVHPHVAEEYPCSICINEKRQRDATDRHNAARIEEHQQLENMILAFKTLYASMDPQRNEPSEEYITSILLGKRNSSNRELLIKHAKRREDHKLMVKSLTELTATVNNFIK